MHALGALKENFQTQLVLVSAQRAREENICQMKEPLFAWIAQSILYLYLLPMDAIVWLDMLTIMQRDHWRAMHVSRENIWRNHSRLQIVTVAILANMWALLLQLLALIVLHSALLGQHQQYAPATLAI